MSKLVMPILILIFVLWFRVGYAHPSLSTNSHPHSPSNIFWEHTPPEDGTSAHNHYDSYSFNGAELYIQPAGAGACWDDQQVRVDAISTFLEGHCFVSDTTINGNPTYYLSSAIPSGAKNRIRDAFDEFNGIQLIHPSYQMGAEFLETSSSSGADVIVRWIDLPSSYHGGQATLSETGQSYLDFDSTTDWDTSWQRSKTGVPSNKWHFFSVALHEVGHVFGLGHQPASESDDLMNGPVGEPIDNNGRHFDYIDDDSVFGVVRLYTQPIAPPGPASCTLVMFLGCHQPQCALWDYGYSASNADQYRIEFRPPGGSWSLKTVTPNTSYFPHLGGNVLEWRIRGENSVGVGQYCFFWTSGECNGGGGPID